MIVSLLSGKDSVLAEAKQASVEGPEEILFEEVNEGIKDCFGSLFC